MAVVNYHAQHGHYPPAFLADEQGRPMHSWRVLILPYLDQQELYDRYDFTQPWNSETNLRLATEMPSSYAFHGEYEPGVVTTNYLAVVGENTAWPGAAPRQTDEVTDDISSTILVVENLGEKVHWLEPRDLEITSMSLAVNDPKGVSSKYLTPAVVTLDDTVVKLKAHMPPDVFRAMLTVNGGESLESTEEGWRVISDGRLRKER